MTRKSAKKGRSQDGAAGAAQTQDVPSGSPGTRTPAMRRLWIAVPLAVAIIGAIGIGYQLPNASVGSTFGASVATFEGSESCAGCHQAEAQLWRSSHHALAMQHATDKS